MCTRAARRGGAEPECVIELQRVYNKPFKLIFALLVVKVPLPVLHASTRARSFALMELRSGQRLGDMAAQLQDPQSPPSTSEAAAPVQAALIQAPATPVLAPPEHRARLHRATGAYGYTGTGLATDC